MDQSHWIKYATLCSKNGISIFFSIYKLKISTFFFSCDCFSRLPSASNFVFLLQPSSTRSIDPYSMLCVACKIVIIFILCSMIHPFFRPPVFVLYRICQMQFQEAKAKVAITSTCELYTLSRPCSRNEQVQDLSVCLLFFARLALDKAK